MRFKHKSVYPVCLVPEKDASFSGIKNITFAHSVKHIMIIAKFFSNCNLFIINNKSEFVQPGLSSYTFFNLQTTFESYNYLPLCHYPSVLYHAS